MSDNFEDRLRGSLHARAADVTPDPEMYREVQRRVRRGRAARWSLAGAGVAAVVAVAALVVPSVLDRRIEFEPAPVVTQPPSEEHSYNQTESPVAAMPVADGMVVTDGVSTRVTDLDGSVAPVVLDGPGDESGAGAVTVRPGSDETSTVAVVQLGADCPRLEWTDFRWERSAATQIAGGGIAGSDACTSSPAFSPDGGHVAWVSAGSEPGAWVLETVDWTAEGPGEDDATFDLSFSAEAVVQIDDWFWTQETDAGAVGSIALSVTRDDERAVYLLDVERQGDGTIAISGEPQRSPLHEAYGAAAFADSQSGDGRVSYALLVSRANRQWSVVRSEARTPLGPDHSAQRDLPDAMVPDVPDDLSKLWISALGDTVVFGDGQGHAWLMEFSETGGGVPRELPGTIVAADLFGGGVPAPEPDGGAVPDDRKVAQVDVFFVDEGGECGERVTPQLRSVEGPGVLRGALEHLLGGPTPEEVAGGASDQTGFSGATSGLLNDVSISEDGLARIDFSAELASHFSSASCAANALFAQLQPTVRQFPSVERAIYSFDGNVENFYTHYQMAPPPDDTVFPLDVLRTRDRVLDAVRAATEDDDWGALAELINRETFSCSFSDQNEDCIALWQQQEAEGQDPLGPLEEILRGDPAKIDGAPIWTWPVEHATSEYYGPRTGIQRNGTWRYYQQGGD